MEKFNSLLPIVNHSCDNSIKQQFLSIVTNLMNSRNHVQSLQSIIQNNTLMISSNRQENNTSISSLEKLSSNVNNNAHAITVYDICIFTILYSSMLSIGALTCHDLEYADK